MGGGSWSSSIYAGSTGATLRSGGTKAAFAYSTHTATSTPRSAWKAHADLEPNGVVRESRDSDEHPTSTAIAVLFDVTGSMHVVPEKLVGKLPELLGLLLRKGYVEHPQILMGAIGDATCDKVPLQAGQFESDNRLDENLTDIFLEHGGGGSSHESYELALWWVANRTATDCFDKRGHKGYLFIIGDEQAYPKVKAHEIEHFLGGEAPSADVAFAEVLAQVREKWNVFFIMPDGTSYFDADGYGKNIHEFWRKHLGQNFIIVPDTVDGNGNRTAAVDAVPEVIALTIGLAEDAIDLADGMDDLTDIGSTAHGSVSKALAHVGSGAGGAVAVADSPTDLDTGYSSGSTRL